MKQILCGPRAVISADALRHNLGVVRKLAPRSRVLAIIKANAYGHGIVPTARALQDADAFGVARIEEGTALRQAGIGNPILLLEGVFTPQDLALAASANLELVVHSFGQLQLLEQFAGTHRFSIWLKIDTGMHRLGFSPEDFPLAWKRIQRCPSAAAGARVMTHLAIAEEPVHPLTVRQLQCFEQAVRGLETQYSMANSAAIIGMPQTHLDWVRPGIMLYGISPLPDKYAAQLDLQPAMTLHSSLIAVHQLNPGETVGYGARWRAERSTRIGVAAIGYGDGYPRHARSGAPVCVADRQCLLAGRVSMDMINVDLTGAPEAQAGDSVLLWGPDLPVEHVAAYADTIPYELVCGISQRVKVQYK